MSAINKSGNSIPVERVHITTAELSRLQSSLAEKDETIAELRARCEAVERDAERYRWLTKLPKSKDELLAFVVFNGNPSEAIDAAIAAQYAQRKEEGKVSDCPKICLACRHFYFNGGERGYSSMTPGSDMQAYCAKQHWDAFEETAERFFEDNLRARTCPDYEVSDLAKRHGWKNPE
jgi:hypothetical protein